MSFRSAKSPFNCGHLIGLDSISARKRVFHSSRSVKASTMPSQASPQFNGRTQAPGTENLDKSRYLFPIASQSVCIFPRPIVFFILRGDRWKRVVARVERKATRPEECTSRSTRNRAQDRASLATSFPYGDFATDACTRRFDQVVARLFQRERYRLLLRRITERASVATGMV